MKLLEFLKNIKAIVGKLNIIKKTINKKIVREDILEFISNNLNKNDYTKYEFSEDGLCFSKIESNIKNCFLIKFIPSIEDTCAILISSKFGEEQEKKYYIEFCDDKTIITETKSSIDRFQYRTVYEYLNGWLIKEVRNCVLKTDLSEDINICERADFDIVQDVIIKRKEIMQTDFFHQDKKTEFECKTYSDKINIDSKLNKNKQNSFLIKDENFLKTTEKYYNSVKKELEDRKILKL